MRVIEQTVPRESVLYTGLNKAEFSDAYAVPFEKDGQTIHEIYLAIFSHAPSWVKILMAIRSLVVVPFGLKGTTQQQFTAEKLQKSYKVGDTICSWEIFSQSEHELITGINDKHLDFRVSLLRMSKRNQQQLVLSTVVTLNNVFGWLYLRAIIPFHRRIVRALIENAVKNKRI